MLKKKIDRTSYKEILPMLFAGSPYWTASELFSRKEFKTKEEKEELVPT